LQQPSFSLYGLIFLFVFLAAPAAVGERAQGSKGRRLEDSGATVLPWFDCGFEYRSDVGAMAADS
jgi:hypothetical protein